MENPAATELLDERKKPRLSIAMSVYNAGEKLELAVLSVIKQTFCDWELLIIDDGSTDGAVARINLFQDSRVRVVSDGENHGLAARLNQAVSLSRGEYVARMDQDDICHPDRFEKQIVFLESNPTVDLVGTRCMILDEKDDIVGLLPYAIEHAAICRYPWLGFYLPHPTWMAKATWHQANRYLRPGPYCCEDQELILRTFLSSRFHVLPEVLLAYRVRSRIILSKMWRTRISLLKLQISIFVRSKSYLHGVFAVAATFGKMVNDLCGKILGINLLLLRGRRSRRDLPATQVNEWESIIAKLRRELSSYQSPTR